MFSVSARQINGFQQILLQDLSSGTTAGIVPSCGAALQSFTVVATGEQALNVIEFYEDAADFAANVASKGFRSCKLSPFACRVNDAAYHFAGRDYRLGKYLSGGSALHGLLYDADFNVAEAYADDSSAGVALKFDYQGSDGGYPFLYECKVAYHLKKNNELSIVTEIINKDKGLIPVQDGWHPYFSLGSTINELQLEFQSKEMVVMSEALIPTGELVPYQEFGSLKFIGDAVLDNCFTVNFAECQPLCVLRSPEKKLQVEIRPDQHYPYLQIYTPPHRKSIAIENLSAPPDAFNNKTGLIILQPGENIIFTTTYKITLLI